MRTMIVAMVVICGLASEVSAIEDFPLRDAVECTPRGGLPNFFAKLEKGGEVNVAYFGGSITAQRGWRVKSLAYFAKHYPKANLKEINAAIGGPGSLLGVFRLEHDVLQNKPDLVFIEFAENDEDGGGNTAAIIKAMEGIVRKTWKACPTCDICFVYTLVERNVKKLQEGKMCRSASAMEQVADHYGIPTTRFGGMLGQSLCWENWLTEKEPRMNANRREEEPG
jgi:hypothetical protein